MFIKQNQEKNFNSILFDDVLKSQSLLTIIGAKDTLSAYLTFQLYCLLNRTILVVTETSDDARKYVDELIFFSGNKVLNKVVHFPAYNLSPIQRISYHNKISSKRIECLYKLLKLGTNGNLIIVTDIYNLKKKLIPKNIFKKYIEIFKIGDQISLDSFIGKLTCGGYKNTVIVEEPGDFSARGKIIDFFPPAQSKPIRIEFSHKHIESIRIFSPINQLTFDSIDHIILLPACEAILEKDKIDLISGKIRSIAIKQKLPQKYISKIIKDISSKNTFSGIDKVTPIIYDDMSSLFDYLPTSAAVVTLDYSKLKTYANKLDKEFLVTSNNYSNAREIYMSPKNLFFSLPAINKEIESKTWINYNISKRIVNNINNNYNFKQHIRYINCGYNDDLSSDNKKVDIESKHYSPFFDILVKNSANGCLTILVCSSERQTERLQSLLFVNGIKSSTGINFSDFKSTNIYICIGIIRSGFILYDSNLHVITYEEIFGIIPKHRKFYSNKIRTKILDLEDLKNGEFVVHAKYGIGRYDGLVKLKINRIISEFLLISYRDGDKFYLPIDNMNFIQKYMGIEENFVPPLDKMGVRSSWERLKGKARRSAERIAAKLLKFYAKRKTKIGYSFTYNKKLLANFESHFSYEETPDQLRAIRDVIKDMKKNTPMDRLICGDVGYGKTEVALRASFIAISDSKQVAVLVPTTVLAEQHFITFSGRFKDYSIKISCLSRFKSKNEQKNIVQSIKDGNIDIVIGTHRLLQEDVSFMDLGLVILDEEQRFGVKHKEKLKEIKNSVDVLTLTATPIPRTLHLSLMGLRDISIISTPPDQRRSIITYVCEFDDEVIVKAIRNELLRGGQIFFIHNNIRDIQAIADHLSMLVKEVKLGIAHGKMTEDNLEKVMMNFVDGNINLLVCTTIIESGIDVVRANTIMVNRADKFGLSQIYQIRGRVGRSDRQAYAYLFVSKERILSKKANKRLKVLMEHSDLGSGFQIAMNDMKIRGGGSILGASQSGHVASVGYDMFLKLMQESIAELKGEVIDQFFQIEINIPISAFISENYIPDIDQRLSIYRRLSKVKNMKDLLFLKEELVDRFGLMPNETKNFLFKIMIKLLAFHARVKKIDVFNNNLTLVFVKEQKQNFSKIKIILAKEKRSYTITTDGAFIIQLKGADNMSLMAQVRNILIELTRHVSS